MIQGTSTHDFVAMRLDEALRYWERKRLNRAMPSRSDLDPAEIVSLLLNVVLVDVLRDPLDFRFRLVGTGVRDRLKGEYTGHRFSELWPDRDASRMWRDFTAVAVGKQPLCADLPYAGPDREIRSARHVLMPLSDDGDVVNMIFGLVEFDRAQPQADR